ncbi:uncharacterized protein [Amphiura filiformis]|uniref:uncharacterized protein n=1 Tax=Amphiura filiformis TaxID=82378 RepID=UPI003B20E63A
MVFLRTSVGFMFGILHNSIRKYNSNREIYRKARVIDDLTDYLKCKDDMIKLQCCKRTSPRKNRALLLEPCGICRSLSQSGSPTYKPLEKLLKSGNKDLQDASSYALWQIKGTSHENIPIRQHPAQYSTPLYEASIKQPKQLRSKSAQIMISYQWDSKPTATKLRDSLVNSGYRVWMDDTHMSGDILAAMAEAVEKSHVVLICMSEAYKNSQNCRSEAEYVYKLKKSVIPLLIEAGYQPDGWLGLLQGTKLYYNFYSDRLMKTELPRLLTAIKDETEGPKVAATQHRGVRSHSGAAAPPTSKSSASNWTESDVQEWLKKNKLDDLCDLMESYDGEHLKEMYNQYCEDRRNFEKDMKSDYQINSRVYLKFTVALL